MDSDGNLDFDRFTSEHNLKYAFDKLRGNGGLSSGIDSIRLDELSKIDVYQGLRVTRDALRNGTYLPSQTRSVSIPKPDGTCRHLEIPTWRDRTVAKALVLATNQFWRARLPQANLDVWDIMAGLSRAVEDGKYFMIADDVRNCFPSVPTQLAIQIQHIQIHDTRTRDLISRVANGWQNGARTRGLDQGNPYSPIVVETFLDHILDQQITAGQNVSYSRYADNLTIAGRNDRECLAAQNGCREELQRHNMQLKTPPVQPMDLRTIREGELEILGFAITAKSRRLRLNCPNRKIVETLQKMEAASRGTNPTLTCEQIIQGVLSYYAGVPENRARRILKRLRDHSNELRIYGIRWDKVESLRQTANSRWNGLINTA